MNASSYHFKLAETLQEVSDYFTLRRSIFLEEQALFQGTDVDDVDEIAYPIIALNNTQKHQVVGVVRIYEPEPGLWYGGRLGVHPDYRRVGHIGKGLIYKAVTTANTWGCYQFLATVQLQNVLFFQRQHWHSLKEITLCDRPHHLMEADLNFYPPTDELRPMLPIQHSEAS